MWDKAPPASEAASLQSPKSSLSITDEPPAQAADADPVAELQDSEVAPPHRPQLGPGMDRRKPFSLAGTARFPAFRPGCRESLNLVARLDAAGLTGRG